MCVGWDLPQQEQHAGHPKGETQCETRCVTRRFDLSFRANGSQARSPLRRTCWLGAFPDAGQAGSPSAEPSREKDSVMAEMYVPLSETNALASVSQNSQRCYDVTTL